MIFWKKPRQLLAYCLENAEREDITVKQKASRRALIIERYRDRRMTVVIHHFTAVCKLGRSMVYAFLSAFLFYLHLHLIRFMDFLNRKERRGTGRYNRNHDPLRSYEVKWARSSLSAGPPNFQHECVLIKHMLGRAN